MHMKTAYVIEGYIDHECDIRLNEPVPPHFNRVLVTIMPIDDQAAG